MKKKKTYFLQFLTKNSKDIQLHLTYDNTQILNIEDTKFLGLMINNRLSWQSHIDLLLVENQYGFQKGLATENAIFKLLNEILNSLNNKMKIGSVVCDLQKVFKSVNH